MNTRRDPDRLIASYFEQDMPELPDRVFEAVRRDIHRTRQRIVLGPWPQPGLRLRGRGISLAAAFVVALSLLIVNLPGLGSGGPKPTVFRSPLYGYAIEVPYPWGTTPATVRWDGLSAPSLGPNVDLLSGPHLIVLGYAGPFGGDLAAFTQASLAAIARDHSDTCPSNALQSMTSISVGGQPGTLLTLSCGAQIDQAITVHDGVAYGFTIRDAGFLPTLDPTDLATVRSMLQSLTFPATPATSS